VEQGRQVVFGPFRLDLPAGRLWQGEREIALRARARAVLCYLVMHPGRVITREELLQHVWAGTHVSKTVLRVCVWEIRQILGDPVSLPQYIETVGQKGYRFLAVPSVGLAEMATPVAQEVDLPPSTAPFVGRLLALATLQNCLAQAQHGVPQLVLVAGDLGVGKTTLVQQFLTRLPVAGPVWVGQGQCIDHAGPGEAYLPLLEALSRLGQGPGGERLIAALRRAAPMWLVQLPMLVEASELETLQRQVQGVSQSRMLRELGEALGVVTRDTVLVLVLEDLHWSDTSTVEGLAYLARRAERLRLLVLGTYRPAEVVARAHPLRQTVQELVTHGLCQELRLELLTPAEVQAYVAQRLGTSPATAQLGELIHRRTDGNALFMVHFLDYLMQQGLLHQEGSQWLLREDPTAVEDQVPDTLRPLLLKQVEALAIEAQQCLAVASVAGMRFTAAEVAAGLQHSIETVEAVCDGLSQQGQLIEAQDVAAWPDGTVTARYGFQHAVYHSLVYTRLGQGQRVRLHHRLGERLEAGYGEQGREIASVLALHFERGRDARRAVQYHGHAAAQALQRSGYPEALLHCQQGLAGLETWPETPERRQQELALRMCLSAVLTATQGHASPALEENLQRAQALCQEIEVTVELAPILVGLSRLSMMQGNREVTEALLVQEQDLLERLHDPAALVQLHTQLGTAETFRGTHARALEHHAHVQRLYDASAHQALAVAFGGDPAAVALGMSGWSLWLRGRPAQAWCQGGALTAKTTTSRPARAGLVPGGGCAGAGGGCRALTYPRRCPAPGSACATVPRRTRCGVGAGAAPGGPGTRTGLCLLRGGRCDHSGVRHGAAGRASTRRGAHGHGHGAVSRHRHSAPVALLSGPPGSGVSAAGPGGRRVAHSRRGAAADSHPFRPLLGGRAVSTAGRTSANAARATASGSRPRCRGRRDMFSASA
jgi:DNA-binding winged helix-turn-helix (wHTH) protein